MVFSRWDLGTEPLEVLDALTAAGYAGRHANADRGQSGAFRAQEIVIDSMTTGSVGRSLPSVAVVAIASTTCCESASVTSPKIVWRRFRCGVLPDGDEELRAVGARARIGHRQQVGLVELQLGVELVGELVARAAATGSGRVAALDHEALDHPVKDRAIVERARGAARRVLGRVLLGALRQANEVGDGLGRVVSEQSDLDVAAVGVQRGGGGLNGAVSHGITVCHYARACPHPVSLDRSRLHGTQRRRTWARGGSAMYL